ncbi:hypothetical protein HDU91_001821, partial [Kappamyces sp. JEL0680]
TKSIIQSFVEGLGASDWWTTSLLYTGSNGAVTDQIQWSGSYVDNYSLGKNLKPGAISRIIEAAIKSARWPKDPNGIYTVFTANDVAESKGTSFCTDYCKPRRLTVGGYHGITTGTQSSNGLKLSMIGDPTRCPGTLPPPGGSKGTSGCMARYWRNQTDPSFSVNGDQAADGMVSVLAHEITETASDYANAWRDTDQGQENADKCAAYFLAVNDISPGQYKNAWNIRVGSNKYLVQSNWHPTKQGCVLKASDEPAAIASSARSSARVAASKPVEVAYPDHLYE